MLSWLFERFEMASLNPAIIWQDHIYTYGWLLEEVHNWQAALDQQNIWTGSVVALEGDYSPHVVASLLALVDRGCIIVPLTSTVEARKPRFLGIAEVQNILRFSAFDKWEFIDKATSVTHPLICKLIEMGESGLVLFSSGSTGEPKAALHNFNLLLEKFKIKRHALRTIAFLLLDHIGGINTLFYVLSNTGTIISIQERNPDIVCATIERHAVELLPTSPTFLNLLLLSEAYRRHDLSSLKQITYGTEPMPESTLKRLHQIFPHVALLQTYGLSEVGILRSKSMSSDSLWVKIGGEGFETKIVNGILWIKAQSAMLGYLNAPSPFDNDGWFNTGDEVIVEGDYVRILGRRSEMINIGGEKVHPAEVESILMEMDNIIDVSVRGEANPITGQIVVARITLLEPEDLQMLRRRIRQYCSGRLSPYKIPAKVEIAEKAQHSMRFKKIRRVDSEVIRT